ncbi:hypothetical protein E3N88_12996 [Mikania micrantha]|uniref:CCHC-type domain-containing protein n=1 Tax=Mikania micrantha TaxID=192012 RepID=A0A5N6LH61_9ASTR|nr:hypothetical protein E3N88_42688 [Mikania micrantha]KAD5961523.1 hypothetical protein E3N88_12996 [Mikania micrantha]
MSTNAINSDVCADNSESVDKIVRDITSSNDYIINRLVKDVNRLTIYRDEIKKLMANVDEAPISMEQVNKNDRFQNIVGCDQPSSVTIRRPIGIRNKGSGSHKRYKSFREISSSKSVGKKQRCCLICGKSGHNQRSCKFKKDGVVSDNQAGVREDADN